MSARFALLFSSLLCLAPVLDLAAASVLQVPRVASPPVVDGKLDDAGWQAACQVTGFHSLSGTPAPETRAWLAYDADALYIAYDCREPEMERLVLTAREHDDPTWKDDCVEIFLDPKGNRGDYLQIVINAAAVTMDARFAQRGAPMELEWETGMEAKTERGDEGWTLECRIPFAGLPLPLRDGDWTGHLARTRAGAGQHLTSLRSAVTGFHETALFDVLRGIRLPEHRLRVAEVDLGEGYVGRNICRIMLVNSADAPSSGIVSLQLGGRRTIRKPISLPPHARESIELPYSLPAGNAPVEAALEVRDKDRLLCRRQRKWTELPPVFGKLPLRAFFQSPVRYVSVEIPVRLAAGSRREARLRWEAFDASGQPLGDGLTTPATGTAVLRLFWQRWRPGRIRLHLRLTTGDDMIAERDLELRLLPDPWEGWSP